MATHANYYDELKKMLRNSSNSAFLSLSPPRLFFVKLNYFIYFQWGKKLWPEK